MEKRFDYLLTLFFAGALTPETRDEFFGMLSSERSCREKYNEMLRIRGQAFAGRMREEIRSDIRPEMADAAPKRRIPAPGIRRWLSAAALLGIAAATALVTRSIDRALMKENLTEQIIRAEAPADSRTRLVLPDSSVVFLNAGSRLTFDAGFDTDARKVHLEGEGYFEVAHDTRRPFSVALGEDIEISVLGTRFNVNAYASAASITTTLLEGSVEITDRATDRVVRLAPNERVSIDRRSREAEVERLPDGNVEIMWKTGCWRFRSLRLDMLCQELERIYGVEIGIVPSPKTRQAITGVVYTGEPIENVLDLLWRTVGLSYRRENGKIILE